jgi:hypothetical protein
MKLDQFVSDTLIEIMTGVADAQHRWATGGKKGTINPVWGGYEKGQQAVREVTFDVAVTVSESTNGKVDGGIKVVGVGVEAGLNKKAENSNVSRISFSVPVAPPIVFIHDDE